ncbi:MAG: hypothetical protein DRJ42_19170 [Deltaproteobacteria bacterium]|nr:MAG: hypothetical protein DRJ42_19170 [Deltaproteobacteria bacterium]
MHASHHLDSYLRPLPEGLESYPECEAKASIYRSAVAQLPKPLDLSQLHPGLVPYIEDPVPKSSWVPEVVNTAIYMAIADQVFSNETAFLDWVEDIGARVFRSPMYRILMAVASPKRLASGGERRWGAFHRGTDYSVTIGENGATTRIEFPPRLFSRLVLDATARSIRAAYRASGADNAIYGVIESSQTHVVMRSVWFPDREG